jgi:hypothetical protein
MPTQADQGQTGTECGMRIEDCGAARRVSADIADIAAIADTAGSGKRRTLFYLHRPAGRYLMY